jgi:hypothetical protein
MKYYGIFVDGKLLLCGMDDLGSFPEIRRRNEAKRLAEDEYGHCRYEIAEVLITRAPKAKKAKASKK